MNFVRMVIAILSLFFISQPSFAARFTGERCNRLTYPREIAECFAAELRQADRELNQVYAQTLASLGAGERPKLVVAQRAWIRFRDLYCAAEVAPYGMGTSVGTVDAACRLALTRQHLTNLRKGFD